MATRARKKESNPCAAKGPGFNGWPRRLTPRGKKTIIPAGVSRLADVQRATPRRARARALAVARDVFCIVRNRTVAMLSWELKWALSGDRWDFQLNSRIALSLSLYL
eukprot:238069-Pyramimonas_sp.AAC.2